ncbi:MAG: zf-TFIIB domain-containing protein [Deltaproteobacteria bacterium]|nr:zf-TFIIB domain-containing protein [Deltaproteobacteria bacterium]
MLVLCTHCNRHVDTGDAAPGDVVRCTCGVAIMVPEGPAAAGKMNCPACGAPVDPALKKCSFCDTRLATVICPACFGVIFDGAKHCPHCGAALEARRVIVHGEETEHLCPRCDDHPKLRVEVVAGCPLERCEKCEGMWVDAGSVDRIYEQREKEPAIQALTKLSATSVPFEPVDPAALKTEGYIKCPECGKMMNRKNFGRFSGVIIDICKEHGTWFDADELRRILEFIASGGLDRQAERERMELREEIRYMRQVKSLQGIIDRAGTGSHAGYIGQGSSMSGADRLLGGSAAISIGSLLRKLF